MRPDLERKYGWLRMCNMGMLRYFNPPLYWYLRRCAEWRHFILVYGTMGFNENADREYYDHMRVVEEVYD